MNRRTFLKNMVSGTAAFMLLPSFYRCSNPSPKPNFLVILCDDLGYGDLACYGNSTIRTPHLDKLASQGWRLTDCYASAPVCSPSRAGLLTGRVPSRIGVYDWIPEGHTMHLLEEEITVASLLRGAGYDTCHIGKWHCNGKFNQPAQPQPDDHGFNYWFSTQNNAAPTHHNPTNFVRNSEPVGELSGYSCQIVADEAIHWLRKERDPESPFFAFICFHEPHEPIASPPELVAHYPEATERGEALYYANVENMDRAVGKLMTALEELNLAENTMVLFTSDNGPETLNRYKGAWRSHGSPGPLRGMKLWLYEGGIRVPGIIRWPNHTSPGKEVHDPVCGLDILPTLCALGGALVPDDRVFDGTSIVPLFRHQALQRETPLYWHYYRSIGKPKAAMRVGDWMILGHWDQPRLGPGGSLHPGDSEIIKSARLVDFELYNLRQDPEQTSDVAGKYPDRMEELKSMLVAKYQEVQEAGPVWEMEA